jgi:hypothetical protein
MAKPRRYGLREKRDAPLGWDELDALERELVDDLVAAICSAKRRHRPDYGTPPSRTQQLALELT